MEKIRRNFAEFFEDTNAGGTLSMSRLLMFLLVCFYLISGAYVVSSTGIIPDVPIQLVGLMALLYGINKVGPNIGVNLGNSEIIKPAVIVKENK